MHTRTKLALLGGVVGGLFFGPAGVAVGAALGAKHFDETNKPTILPDDDEFHGDAM